MDAGTGSYSPVTWSAVQTTLSRMEMNRSFGWIRKPFSRAIKFASDPESTALKDILQSSTSGVSVVLNLFSVIQRIRTNFKLLTGSTCMTEEEIRKHLLHILTNLDISSSTDISRYNYIIGLIVYCIALR